MKYLISYEVISPAVLGMLVEKACCNAIPTWHEVNEDYFEFSYMSWLPMTTAERMIVKNIITKYI